MSKAKDLTGQRFGKLTVIRRTDRRSETSVVWECRCDCGNIKLVSGGHLTSGAVKSCGCLRKKKQEENKEGLAEEKFEYPLNLWSAVLERPISTEELPEDWEPALDHVLSTLGSDKKKEIVLNRYKDKLTLAAIGDLYGLSRQAVAQYMERTIGKLRQPARKVFFLYGLEREMVEEKPAAANQQDADSLRALCLSARPFNCLIKAGVTTIGKLLECTEKDLSQMRNMGKNSVAEIKAKLTIMGLSLREPSKEGLTGQRFGMLTVVGPTKERKNGSVVWECKCDCGKTTFVTSHHLNNGDTKSCGCTPKKRKHTKDLSGQRFGMLTVVAPTEKRQGGNVVWECKCDCGKSAFIPTGNLKRGATKSCGCLLGARKSNLIGKKFGMLTVVALTEKRQGGNVVWECKCDCGNIRLVSTGSLTNGSAKSCGCHKTERKRTGPKVDLTGQRFGMLTAIRPTEKRQGGSVVWECCCDCENTAFVPANSLKSGKTKSCGCHKTERKRTGPEVDLTGQRFGMLTVVAPTEKRQGGSVVWECKCDCGKTKLVTTTNLKHRVTKSCGCLLGARRSNLIGKKFGMLTVVALTEKRQGGNVVWECKCDCGNIRLVSTGSLTNGSAKSCGCHKTERKRTGPEVDLTGQRFGMLTVVGPTEKRQGGSVVWECCCDCGNTRLVRTRNLKEGIVKSCGCASHKVIR